MSAPCTRLWEVEAERDGRLDDDARASATRHRSHCRACRDEHAALADLGRKLAAEQAPPWDALAQKRLRGKVLAGANEARLRAPDGKSRVLVAIALAAAIVIGVVATRKRAPVASLPVVAAIELRDEGNADYERVTRDGTEHVYLRAGALGLKVHHEVPTRLLVHVPDGEIEDLGTIFHVSVREGATVRVAVDEGRVLVRRANGDRDGRVVSAGETWEPASEANAIPAPSATAPASVATASTASPVEASPAPETKLAPKRPAPPSPPPASAAAPRSSAPHPPSEEDATYMHVVSLLRAGKRDEARAAARRYVVLYPNGLRRQEMDVVAE